VDGGEVAASDSAASRRDLLLTGHEDGSVRAWDAGGATLRPLARFHTAPLFAGEEREAADRDEDIDEWPPFVKVHPAVRIYNFSSTQEKKNTRH
jgi:lethal(2) giant larvae protein